MNRIVIASIVLVLAASACALPMPPSTDASGVAPAIPTAVQPTATNLPDTTQVAVIANNEWEIQYFKGATQEMHDWTFMTLAPSEWPMFPNVDNGHYPASQGVEYGEDLSAFCQQDERCDFNIAARHYRAYSGDYSLEGVGSCNEAETGKGCLLLAVNIGEVTAMFRDQEFDYGFTVTGRYWDGNYLSQAMWAVMSHMSANMLNMNTSLNPGGTNAGANCSVPGGCSSVEATFVVTSGNEILMIGRSVVSK